MTWKSTALVSSATLLATWFASAPPARRTSNTTAEPARDTTQTAAPASDIAREAERLRARLHPATPYHEPARNPFRFGERTRPARPAEESAAMGQPSGAVPQEPQIPTLRVTLSGIAEDVTGAQLVRTAIISTPDDVLLVKEGDSIAGQYRVTDIAEDSVELTRQSDNSVVRLSLRP